MSIFSEKITILDTNNSKVLYQQSFLDDNETQAFYHYFLNNISWQHDQAKIYGKTIITKREIAWFADKGFDYNYSGASRIAQEWDAKLLKLKLKLENETGYQFNSCLLNLYHDGSEGMAWHSDDQNHLELNSPVAIISLGAQRYFKLRETKLRDNQRKLTLEKGSLLLILYQTQVYWQYEIPKMTTIKEPRISLTWRSMSLNKLRN
jgi:alkylated DNA repair dioxygenase AlkB